MGYKMEYNLKSIKFIKSDKRKEFFCHVLLVLAITFGAGLLHFSSAVLETVMLGKGQTASKAAEEMVTNLKDGFSLSDALEVFCQEVAG